ncbi:MAG: NIPSNAP family protein [Acetobacteraceae bacterium]
MIVDLRIYTARPGKLAAFVKLYRDHAWAIQQKHLGTCVGWYTVAEGPLNQVVHMWRYESMADRDARRSAMAADPAWIDYLRVSEEAGLLVAQENRILRPTDFSPVG